jgi:hypothetical protein
MKDWKILISNDLHLQVKAFTKGLTPCFNPGVAYSVDTNLNESEAAFESEFHKLYGDKNSEAEAAEALAEAEEQVPVL